MPVVQPVSMIHRKQIASSGDLSAKENHNSNQNNKNGNVLNKKKRKIAFDSADSHESFSAT